jgi:hypothetical protein
MALTSSVLLPAAIDAVTGLVPNSSSITHLAFATKQQRVSQGARLVQPTTRVMASTEGGGGPNPMRFFQSFKDSLFQDHKRIQLEQSKWPKGHDFVYKVEKGDTLWKIAERHNTSIDLLMEVRLPCRNYRHIFCSITAFAISCCSQVISLVPPTIVSNPNN